MWKWYLIGGILLVFLSYASVLLSCNSVVYRSVSPDGGSEVLVQQPLPPFKQEGLEVIIKVNNKSFVVSDFHGSGSMISFAHVTWTDQGKQVGIVIGGPLTGKYAFDLQTCRGIDFSLVEPTVRRDLSRRYSIPEGKAIEWALAGGPENIAPSFQ